MPQLRYPDAVKERTPVGQSARSLIFKRYAPRDWSSPGSTDANFAAVTLVFRDGTTITEARESGHGSGPPYDHAEARALAAAIGAGIDNGKPEFSNCQKLQPDTGQAQQTHFDQWKPALSQLQKIIIYSDRSCCPSCIPFFNQLFECVSHEIVYDIGYKRGFSADGTSLQNAKHIVKGRVEKYAAFEAEIIKAREVCEQKISSIEFFDQEKVDDLEAEFLVELQEISEKITADFSIKDSEFPGLEIKSTEAQHFAALKAQHLEILNAFLKEMAQTAYSFEKGLTEFELSESQSDESATSSPPHKKVATDSGLSEKLGALQDALSSQAENPNLDMQRSQWTPLETAHTNQQPPLNTEEDQAKDKQAAVSESLASVVTPVTETKKFFPK